MYRITKTVISAIMLGGLSYFLIFLFHISTAMNCLSHKQYFTSLVEVKKIKPSQIYTC